MRPLAGAARRRVASQDAKYSHAPAEAHAPQVVTAFGDSFRCDGDLGCAHLESSPSLSRPPGAGGQLAGRPPRTSCPCRTDPRLPGSPATGAISINRRPDGFHFLVPPRHRRRSGCPRLPIRPRKDRSSGGRRASYSSYLGTTGVRMGVVAPEARGPKPRPTHSLGRSPSAGGPSVVCRSWRSSR